LELASGNDGEELLDRVSVTITKSLALRLDW